MESERGALRISASSELSADHCATFVLERLREALADRPVAAMAISGGHTPKLFFAKLAASGLDWPRVHVFWVDERCVPPTSDQSNFKLANETLLDPARIPVSNIHRVQGELPPEEAASAYLGDIRKFFQLSGGDLPAFDVIHRGIGNDAHTASLFPGEPLIRDRTGIAAAVYVEKLKSHRVTLLPGVLLAGRSTVIQAEGEDKAEPVYNVLFGSDDPMRYPCQIAARGFDKTVWFLDKAAASKIPRSAEATPGA